MKHEKINATKKLEKQVSKKEKCKQQLLEYMGNPSNPFLTRHSLSTNVLGYASGTEIYRKFTSEELSEIKRKPWISHAGKLLSQLALWIWPIQKRLDGSRQQIVYSAFELVENR